jgi:hypothetical protein
VAARGIDISGLPYVINMTLPDKSEDYIHRCVGFGCGVGCVLGVCFCAGTAAVWAVQALRRAACAAVSPRACTRLHLIDALLLLLLPPLLLCVRLFALAALAGWGVPTTWAWPSASSAPSRKRCANCVRAVAAAGGARAVQWRLGSGACRFVQALLQVSWQLSCAVCRSAPPAAKLQVL